MSRPKSFTVRTWATGDFYPAGADPWSSQPIKVEHPGPAGGFVPGQGAGSPYVNKLFFDAFTQDEGARQFAEWVGQAPMLNWDAPSSLTGLVEAVWSQLDRKWYACGGTSDDNVRSSARAGKAFDASTIIPIGQRASVSTESIDIDTSGNLLVTGATSTNYFWFDRSTGNWTRRTTLTAMLQSNAMFDQVSGLWVVIGLGTGGNFMSVFTSPDATTWTSRTLPVQVGDTFAGFQTGRSETNKLGRIVAVRGSDGSIPDCRIATSDNGGVTWAYRGQLTNPWNQATAPKPAANGTTWLLPTYRTSGGKNSRIYRSTDNGDTWAPVFNSSTVAITFVVAFGAAWVGVTSDGDVLYSLDDGATWRWCNVRTSAPKGIFAGNSSLLIIGNNEVFPGLVFGAPGDLVT